MSGIQGANSSHNNVNESQYCKDSTIKCHHPSAKTVTDFRLHEETARQLGLPDTTDFLKLRDSAKFSERLLSLQSSCNITAKSKPKYVEAPTVNGWIFPSVSDLRKRMDLYVQVPFDQILERKIVTLDGKKLDEKLVDVLPGLIDLLNIENPEVLFQIQTEDKGGESSTIKFSAVHELRNPKKPYNPDFKKQAPFNRLGIYDPTRATISREALTGAKAKISPAEIDAHKTLDFLITHYDDFARTSETGKKIIDLHCLIPILEANDPIGITKLSRTVNAAKTFATSVHELEEKAPSLRGEDVKKRALSIIKVGNNLLFSESEFLSSSSTTGHQK